jgi:hypothetical protein
MIMERLLPQPFLLKAAFLLQEAWRKGKLALLLVEAMA